MNEDYIELGKSLMIRRIDHNYNFDGISNDNIEAIENGHMDMISFATMEEYLNCMDIQITLQRVDDE